MSDYKMSTSSGEAITSLEGSTVNYEDNLNMNYLSYLKQGLNLLMDKTNYNHDIIPIILSTDVHNRYGEHQLMGVYRWLADTVEWQAISKVVNLGDNSNDGYLSELIEVGKVFDLLPLEKQCNVWGNHDYGNGSTYDQAYLKKYFKNPHSTTFYGGGNGYFAMVDPLYNVKYLAINNMEHINASSNEMMTTKQIAWLIKELEKADGYDIILVSHWFLDCMNNTAFDKDTWTEVDWTRTDEPFLTNETVYADFLQMIADRKNKASGTFTDDEGITHEYDFTGCNSELLISLAGHDHIDFHKHIENSITQIEFDCYKEMYAFYFCWIDRENKKFGWWKADPYRLRSWEIDIN